MKQAKDHESSERIHEIERKYDEFQKGFIGKHEVTAKEKVEETERQHTTTTATKREELVGEAEQQHTTTTAAHREELVDSKEEKFLVSSRKERIWIERRRPR